MKPSLSILRARLAIVVAGALCTVLVASPATAKKRSAAIPGDARVLKVKVDKSHAIDEHRLEIRMSRPPGKILLTVTSEDGHVIVDRVDDLALGAPAPPISNFRVQPSVATPLAVLAGDAGGTTSPEPPAPALTGHAALTRGRAPIGGAGVCQANSAARPIGRPHPAPRPKPGRSIFTGRVRDSRSPRPCW